MSEIVQVIAQELNVQPLQVAAAVKLLDEGATVPFIARYRKEVTGGLDDGHLRTLESRLIYLRELNERRAVILKSIKEQEKLTPQLESSILAATSKTDLEELYLPYKPKRRTKGQIAIEAGLEPLADSLLADLTLNPDNEAEKYLNAEHNINIGKDALDGARYILMERFAVDAELLKKIRTYLWQNATLDSAVIEGKQQEGAKFADYFEFSENLNSIPSHRALAVFRGRNEGILTATLNADPQAEEGATHSAVEVMIADHYGFEWQGRAAETWLKQVIKWTWRIKISTHMETELFAQVRDGAEDNAIKVFATNLKDLLMAAPAGAKATIGLDPGIRTGVKVAVVDNTGKVLDTAVIYPHEPQNAWDKSKRTLANLARKHKAQLISIGNGTGSRETDKLVGELMKDEAELKLVKVMVNEAGASVYSASETAALEFPNMDVSLRGAVSIARRLQDPLAELVKIEPKSIGVGQYQHDVSQSMLARALDAVVEDCVNAVGVDLNMASVPLLTRVSGLNKTLAQNIVEFRDSNGRFQNRSELKKVTRLGPKAFEQCAGFLRIADGDNPLDASSVHPEAYPVVKKIVEANQVAVNELIGNSTKLKALKAADYTDEKFGLPTVTDIIKELDKPGRDPRPEFKTATFKEGVDSINDLKVGMKLEGVVTNVTNFGAFIDVGVHQDGLVHISAMSETFIDDPRKVVKAGDIVKVKVTEVDVARKRIGFTMRLNDEVHATASDNKAKGNPNQTKRGAGNNRGKSGGGQKSFGGNSLGGGAMGNAFAEAFAKAKK
ncbi:RNA-binding transcriptional accessory protein [Saccharobesus litoralis]|uniref:RNA-binding transcriptional accessory protein n=1 Tax=Saccharobesus litoralis TaxID=2172099 RepID=A0A2S0VRM6_9ALTE|nr:Tex family protein [Saccharobesus litoralis]AWB66865.1 RNA-binding transcriptional accessory protein [Saccharobesus litoralis]